MRFNQVNYTPSRRNKEIVKYVLQRKEEMDTEYRERAVRLAKWARDDYMSMSDDRISNMDLMKISLSYPIVNQRCSTLFNNRSRADYRTIDKSKKYDVEILKKVDEYDMQVGNFNSDYQDIEMTANIEGSCFFRVNWEEQFDDSGNTVGVPHVSQKRVRMNDFWWDQGARTMKEANHGMERKVMTYERYLRLFVPMDSKDGFKNIRAVQPMSRADCEDTLWQEEWERYGRDDSSGNYVTLWIFESISTIEGGKIVPKAYIIANGVCIYEAEKLFVPKKAHQQDLLSWSKIDGIPTGTMVGMGIPVLIRHPQEAFNRLITLSVAQAELAVSPPVFTGPQMDLDWDDYPLEAGRTIPVRGSGNAIANSYHWFQVPDITNGSQKIMNDLIEYVIMVTGVDIRALFVPASEKAITTVNKREIQEKLLRFSVQWNEDHGFYDLALRRLRYIQHYYPKKRTFLEEKDGQIIQQEGFLTVPVKDYETQEVEMKGRKRIKLNFKEGGYTKIDVSPENLDFNVDLVIEGATSGQERDAIEKKNFLESLQVLFSIPAFAQKIQENPDKSFKYFLDKLDIPLDEILEDAKNNNQNLHPALKEIAAIEALEVMKEQGFKIPEDLPIPDDYDPKEYVDVYTEIIKQGRDKEMKKESKDIFYERFEYHQKNARNPYFYEMQEKNQEKPVAPVSTPQLPVPKEEAKGLEGRMRQEAAEIANITR